MLELFIYTSSSCAPCAIMKLELAKLQKEYGFELTTIEASAKTKPQFAEMGIRSVPTTVCFDDMEIVGVLTGVKQPTELCAQLEAWGMSK